MQRAGLSQCLPLPVGETILGTTEERSAVETLVKVVCILVALAAMHVILKRIEYYAEWRRTLDRIFEEDHE